MSKASDILDEFILIMSVHDNWQAPHTKYGPGQLLAKMTPEEREAIMELRSDDIKDIRPDYLFGRNNERVRNS